MNKNNKLIQAMEIALYILQAIMVAMLLIAVMKSVLANFDIPDKFLFISSFARVHADSMNSDYSYYYQHICSFFVYSTQFLVFHQIRKIISDMKNGIRFEKKHVKRVRLIALFVFVQSALVTAISYIIPPVTKTVGEYTFAMKFTVIDTNFIWAIVLLFLAQIFAHGVEVQTDSDMTV